MDQGRPEGFRQVSGRRARTDRRRFDIGLRGPKGRYRQTDIAKPMKGLGVGVFEIALRYRSDAYRAVYALRVDEDIWVIHAFQKKAQQGIKTPQKEIDLIKQRVKRLRKDLEQ